MNSITYAEAKQKLDQYRDQRVEFIRKHYNPHKEEYSEQFRKLGEEMIIRENMINILFNFADDDPYAVMRPQRMD